MKLIPVPKWLARAALTVAAVNFFASWWIFSKLGGYASEGHVVGGHYFLSFGKGTFVEVSRATFKFSWWYENTVSGILVLALLLEFFSDSPVGGRGADPQKSPTPSLPND